MDFSVICQNIVKILTRYWDVFLIDGLKNTLILSVITVAFGSIIGAFLCLGKMSRFAPLRWVITALIEIVRGTPMLLQLYMGYFILPKIITFVQLSEYAAISLALVLNSACYVSEVIRSGIQAVDKGQTEAARSLGLGKSATMIYVVLPQAVKNILPALGNEFITVIKETSLASTFFIGDLMTSFKIVNGAMYLTIEPLIIIGVIYFVLTFTLSKLLAFAERRMKHA
jgi:His/Glu/Gln/Arg/opine family amino acid ABC transporter permease subunit